MIVEHHETDLYRDRRGNYVPLPAGRSAKARRSGYGIYIRDGKVLVVKPNWIDLWELPGGGLEGDESLGESMIRELSEETGLVVEAYDPEPFYRFHTKFYPDDLDEFFDSVMNFYLVNEAKGELMGEDETGEIVTVAWLDVESLKAEDFSDLQRRALTKIDPGDSKSHERRY
jgi:8-oxo-dGTP pyrophosphatase MutT (NUDIX family)